MDEQEKTQTEENKSQTANENTNDGLPRTNEGTPTEDHLGLIAKANAAAERIEKANREMDSLLKKQELLQAEQRLQGRTFAGQGQKAEPTIKDKAAEFFKGTSIAEAIKKHG